MRFFSSDEWRFVADPPIGHAGQDHCLFPSHSAGPLGEHGPTLSISVVAFMSLSICWTSDLQNRLAQPNGSFESFVAGRNLTETLLTTVTAVMPPP